MTRTRPDKNKSQIVFDITGGEKEYRIYDQTLTEYTISFDKGFNANWYWYANVVEDYIFFYSSADKKSTCLCANYKTGERFAQEESESFDEVLLHLAILVTEVLIELMSFSPLNPRVQAHKAARNCRCGGGHRTGHLRRQSGMGADR